MKINADGTITARWAEVRRILNKDAEEITEEEYNALAVLYLNMGEEDLAQFLKLCMDKVEDVKDTSKWIGNGSGVYTDNKEDYSVWEIDEEKVQKILNRIVLASDETLLTLQMIDSEAHGEIYKALMNQRDIMLQRISLLKIVSEIGEFRGWYQEEEPVVSVDIDEVGVITLEFCERRDICDTACTQMSNMGESSVKISETRNGIMINWKAIEEGRTSVDGYLGISSCGEVSDISEYALEQLGNQILGNVIGGVPYVGGALTFVMSATDATIGYQGRLNDAKFIAGEYEQLKKTNIYTIFDCSANLIEYDVASAEERKMYVQPGRNTQAIIERVNDELKTKFVMEDVIINPIEVCKIINQLIEENPENANAFNKAIIGDKERMYEKKIIKVGIGFILLIMVITIAIVFYKHEKEKERLSREPYFTEYELNDTEMDILNLEYHVKVTPEMRKLAKEDNEDIWPDFRFVTIEPTEDTEVVVTVMNYLLFDCQEESNKSGRETANKYGISKENRLTVEWVMSHPREAVDIMNEMLEARNDFMYLWNGIYSLYEKITGTPLERSEP